MYRSPTNTPVQNRVQTVNLNKCYKKDAYSYGGMKTCRPDNSLYIITLHFKRLSVLVVKCYFRVGKIMVTLDQILNVPRSELKLDVCIPATAKIKLRSRVVGFD